MDCRETQTLLSAFHDGELPAADRARVEDHLRGCPKCVALLADLARADQAAGVPDPGSAYWNRFNARVMDRVEREADGPGVAVLRPKHGWMRQQLRYLVPAAAAAALVVVIVHYGGMHPAVPTKAMDGQVPGQAEMPRGLSPRPPVVPPAVSEPAESSAVAPRVPPPLMKDRHAPADAPPSPAKDGMPRGMWAERKKMEEDAALMADRQGAGKVKSSAGMRMTNDLSSEAPPKASFGETRSKAGPSTLVSASPRPASPCELAHTLADLERFREAESAQRECLAGDLPAPDREKNLVFLAELLDRQARFAEADSVIAEVDRQYPQSRPLDLYRQRRSMVQKHPAAAPVTR